MNGGAGPVTPQALNRILITADAVGGVWQYTVDLACCLVRERVSVTVATMGPRPSEEQRMQLPPGVRLVSREFALEWQQDPWDEVDAAGHWLLELRDECCPDLMHLNGYAHAALAWDCPVLVVAHSCVVSWWRAVHGCEPPREWDEYRRRVRAGLLACDAVIAPSEYIAAEVEALYQVPAQKIRKVWNFSSTPSSMPVDKEPFCLAAGRVWDEAKNFSLLREVAQEISWPIYLAGSNELSNAMEPVKMLGHIPYGELLNRMGRATIFVHPALYEPFGLAILEAARAGCCLVLADTVSARELWGDAALFADARDASKWAEVIERLSHDPVECLRLGRAACEHSKRYNEMSFHQSYMAAYHDLLNRRSSEKGVAA